MDGFLFLPRPGAVHGGPGSESKTPGDGDVNTGPLAVNSRRALSSLIPKRFAPFTVDFPQYTRVGTSK